MRNVPVCRVRINATTIFNLSDENQENRETRTFVGEIGQVITCLSPKTVPINAIDISFIITIKPCLLLGSRPRVHEEIHETFSYSHENWRYSRKKA